MVPMSARRKSSRRARRREARADGSAPAGRPHARAAAGVAAVLAVAAIVAYLPSLRSGFLSWDDDTYVTENRHVAAGLSWDTVVWAFTRYHSANWHPLTWLSHAADVSLYGLDSPRGHHLTNVLLHAANTVLLLVALRRLTGRLWPSAAVAGLFALHPLHVESVAWIAERKDLLCALFMFLAVWAYAVYASGPTWRRYLLVVAAFAAALMSKPMAVTLPLALLVLDWWPLGRLGRRAVLEKVPLLVMSAASSLATFLIQRADGGVHELGVTGLAERVCNVPYAYVMYLVKMVWPAPGSLVPLYPLTGLGGPVIRPWMAIGLALVLAVVTILVVWQRRRRPYLLAGWLIYVVMLVPVIGLVQAGRQMMADRYTYVPLVGVFVAVVFLVAHAAAGRPRLRRAAAALAAVVLVALGALSWHQQRVWANSITFWSYVAEAYPQCCTAYTYLGWDCAGTGDNRRALAYFQKAVEVDPDDVLANINLGTALQALGRFEPAMAQFRHTLEMHPDAWPARYNMGVILLSQRKAEAAAEQLRIVVREKADYAPAWLRLGVALRLLDRPDEAKACFSRARQLDPGRKALVPPP